MRIRLIVALLVLFTGFAAGAYLALAQGVPSIEDLKKRQTAQGTKVYADDDTLIGEFRIEKGEYVPLGRVPSHLKNAVIAVEDSRFWQHKGLDYIGIARALVKDILHMSLKEGGSTITQQLAKILFLSPEKTFKRKFREAQLAFKLENELSKNEILELYLNNVYFGHGAYGVEMASKIYFGKSVSSVNLAEAALLAGLIKAPNTFSPYNNLVRAKERQEVVLLRMEEEKYITAAERDRVKKQPISLSSVRMSTEANTYFLEYIRQYLEQKYGVETVYTGGLKVHTTLDRQAQLAAQKALQEGLRQVDKRRGWRGPVSHRENTKPADDKEPRVSFSASVGDISTGVVVSVTPSEATIRARGLTGKLSAADAQWAATILESRTGRTRTLKKLSLTEILKTGDVVWVRFKTISGRQVAFSLEQEPEVEGAVVALEPETGYIRALVGGFSASRSDFNRALYAKRQPGSAFKPIVYAAALQIGFTPASIIDDKPVTYPGGPSGEWTPENYDRRHYGPTRLREALAFSRNVVTVRLAETVGMDKIISFAKQIGIQSPMPRELAVSLGSFSTSPLELAGAYAVFAGGGYRTSPLAIKYITDQKDAVLEQNDFEAVEVMSPQAAFLITSMLQDAVDYGTGTRAKMGRPAAGKTGTSSDYKDAWFVGYTPELVTCVWVGFDDMKRSLGPGEVGGRAAAPIWAQFMRQALAAEAVHDFSVPVGIVRAPVDYSTGLLVSDPTKGYSEYFKAGTQPREYASSAKKVERPVMQGDFD